MLYGLQLAKGQRAYRHLHNRFAAGLDLAFLRTFPQNLHSHDSSPILSQDQVVFNEGVIRTGQH
ncbi:hypothetical protein D3C71_2034360 [compost metagenome]